MLADLAGGADNLFDKLKEAYEKERFQWAVQLADALLEIKQFEKEAKVTVKISLGFDQTLSRIIQFYFNLAKTHLS